MPLLVSRHDIPTPPLLYSDLPPAIMNTTLITVSINFNDSSLMAFCSCSSLSAP